MSTQARTFALAAALLLAFATVIGALNAHQLATKLDAVAEHAVQTAVQYQFYHSLGLLGIALLLDRLPVSAVRSVGWLRTAGWLLVAGIVLFSGSLYALAGGLAGPLRTVVGVLTPLGGLSLILAWCVAAISVARSRSG
jgi:uncharacterized membrane protein YgdD (TMEM256/DUF423 family)